MARTGRSTKLTEEHRDRYTFKDLFLFLKKKNTLNTTLFVTSMVHRGRLCTTTPTAIWSHVVLAWLVWGFQGGTLFDRCEPTDSGRVEPESRMFTRQKFPPRVINCQVKEAAFIETQFSVARLKITSSDGLIVLVGLTLTWPWRKTRPAGSLARAATSAPSTRRLPPASFCLFV